MFDLFKNTWKMKMYQNKVFYTSKTTFRRDSRDEVTEAENKYKPTKAEWLIFV